MKNTAHALRTKMGIFYARRKKEALIESQAKNLKEQIARCASYAKNTDISKTTIVYET